MGGLGSIDDWKDAQLAASDRIHLTKKGYELQADMMFEAFRKAFGDYLNEKYSN
jgi:lysophospholipase L1-like esterase